MRRQSLHLLIVHLLTISSLPLLRPVIGFSSRVPISISPFCHDLSYYRCRRGQSSSLILEATSGDGEDTNSKSSTTSKKPLYDATNYTFPNTTTPSGLAEVIEVSFVQACIQLQSGYVDVLKMFIASVMTGYELRFSITTLESALHNCNQQTANRPLLPEEIQLRYLWLCLIYLTLNTMNHPITVNDEKKSSSTGLIHDIPQDIKEEYGQFINSIVNSYQNTTEDSSLSVDDLMSTIDTNNMSLMEKAIVSQSLRVVTLTPIVVQESIDAQQTTIDPPKPPIKGAFE